MAVRIWSETVSIPTYEVGERSKNPMFLEKRVYQGSTGKVYPLPVIDKISDEKKDKDYNGRFSGKRLYSNPSHAGGRREDLSGAG